MNARPLPSVFSMISDMEPEMRDLVRGANTIALLGERENACGEEAAWAARRLYDQAKSLLDKWQALYDVADIDSGGPTLRSVKT